MALVQVSPGPRAIVPLPEPEEHLNVLQRIQKALSPRTGASNVPTLVYGNGGGIGMVNSNAALARVPGAGTYRAYAATPWVFAGINIRKDQLSSADWDIVPYDNTKRSPARLRDQIKELFDSPSAKMDSFQTFASALVDDILTLDAGVIEKVRYPNGQIAELCPVRGEWIAVDERWDGSDPRAARYYFVPDGQVRATFRNEDMVYMVANPRTTSQTGVSPMLILQTIVESELQSQEYNRRQVMGAAPDGVLNIGEDADEPAVMRAQSKFQAEVFGQGAMAVVGGYKNPAFLRFRDSNRDMQFRELIDLYIRCIAIVLELSPMDLGITFDVNRSTAETQSENTNDRGHRTLMAMFQRYMTREIVWDAGFGGRANNLQFAFKSLNLDETLAKASINKIALGAVGWKSINEAREVEGRAPLGDPTDENNIFNHVLTNTPKGMLDLTAGKYIGEEQLNDLQTQGKIDVAQAVAEAAPPPTTKPPTQTTAPA